MREPRNRVVQVVRFGGPDGLEVVDAPLPTAGRGEVRVPVLASDLEYTDVLIRRHLYPQTMRHRPPFVLGYDVVGEIAWESGHYTHRPWLHGKSASANATVCDKSDRCHTSSSLQQYMHGADRQADPRPE